MKVIYVALIGLFILSSCASNEETNEENKQTSILEIDNTNNDTEGASVLTKIAHQWTLVNRTNTKKDKSVDYSTEAPAIITHFEKNGFFSIYDLLEIKENGQQTETLKMRSSGQWEVHNEDELVMRHSATDSSKAEAYIIQTLNEQKLVIKNSELDIIDTYKRRVKK
ncbi:MAG TPA: hypothetical protein VKY37_04810 [Brumimicrobium sp.]|nr:hypothetical protein [Brumimicrobium sp.]